MTAVVETQGGEDVQYVYDFVKVHDLPVDNRLDRDQRLDKYDEEIDEGVWVTVVHRSTKQRAKYLAKKERERAAAESELLEEQYIPALKRVDTVDDDVETFVEEEPVIASGECDLGEIDEWN
jgi:hypothetical protein